VFDLLFAEFNFLTMAEFDTGLPSVRQIADYIKEKKEVELQLTTGDLLVGHVFWQDSECICLVDSYDQQTLVWRQAIVYMKPKF
jgi:host factor-I protein